MADRGGGQADRGHHPDAAVLGELGLLQPASRTDGGERLYGAGDVRRVTRIRDWQELLGFSLDEVKTVLSTGDIDVLDRVHFELRDGEVSSSRRRALLDEAITANDQLVGRLDDSQLGQNSSYRCGGRCRCIVGEYWGRRGWRRARCRASVAGWGTAANPA